MIDHGVTFLASAKPGVEAYGRCHYPHAPEYAREELANWFDLVTARLEKLVDPDSDFKFSEGELFVYPREDAAQTDNLLEVLAYDAETGAVLVKLTRTYIGRTDLRPGYLWGKVVVPRGVRVESLLGGAQRSGPRVVATSAEARRPWIVTVSLLSRR